MLSLRNPATARPRSPADRQPGRFRRGLAKYYVPYLYISPFYIMFLIFSAFPIIYTFYLSFQYWSGIGPAAWVGLENYKALIQDALFWKALYNTVFITIVAHVPMLFLALVIAFIVNSGLVRAKDGWRTVFFLPVVTSSVAVSLIFLTLYGVRFGLFNWLLTAIGLPPIDWWGGTGFWVKPAIIFLFIWRWLGWNMVIYLAGLQGISSELYEAAQIDGAGFRQIFFRITLPLLKPVILFTIIQSTIGGMTIFDEPFILLGTTSLATAGGTDNSGLTLAVYLYQQGFGFAHIGYGAAIAYGISFFIVLLSFLNMRVFGRNTHEEGVA